MVFKIIIGLRDGCPWCAKMRERIEPAQVVAQMIDAQLEVVTSDKIPASVSTRFRGVPICMFTDGNGEILVDKSRVGFMFTDDLEGTKKFMRFLLRWGLAVQTNDV